MMKYDITNKLKSICWSCLAFVVIGVTIVFMADQVVKQKPICESWLIFLLCKEKT